MKREIYSVHVHWDKRYPKKGTDKCPVQIAVRIGGVQFKVGLQLYASKEEFEKAMSGRGGSLEVKELRSAINKYVNKAEHVLSHLPNPTREIFQRVFKSEADLFLNNKTDVTFLYEEYIRNLKKEDRLRTAENYGQGLKSLKQFRSNLYFEEMDAEFLKSYVNWMTANGNSPATAQIYLRGLRSVFNKAITDGYISHRFYPFRKYKIGSSVKSKNVLYPEEVKALYEFKSPLMRERRAKDYWLFCYLANGINPKDMMCMRYKNIDGEYISIVREKTKRTNAIANKEIKIYLHPEMQRIINEWGNSPQDPEQYVFPMLDDTRFDTSAKKELRRKDRKKKVNRVLRDIGEKLGFAKQLNLNLARHSFGTNLKLQGTPIEFIRDLFGHSTSATTAHYLKTLPDNKTKEISETLLKF